MVSSIARSSVSRHRISPKRKNVVFVSVNMFSLYLHHILYIQAQTLLDFDRFNAVRERGGYTRTLEYLSITPDAVYMESNLIRHRLLPTYKTARGVV